MVSQCLISMPSCGHSNGRHYKITTRFRNLKSASQPIFSNKPHYKLPWYLLFASFKYLMTANLPIWHLFLEREQKITTKLLTNFSHYSIYAIKYKSIFCTHVSSCTHLEQHKVLCEQQCSFWKGRACETQLIGAAHYFVTCLL